MNRYWWLILIFLFVEFLSFLGYSSPVAMVVPFFLICLTVFIVALLDFKSSLFIVLAELFIGGFGYLFILKWGGLNISLRCALFLIIFAVTIKKIWQEKEIRFLNSRFFTEYFFLGVILLLAFVSGYLRGFNPAIIFFDFNAFIFLFYLFAFYQNLAKNDIWRSFFSIFLISMVWLSLKVVIVFVLFLSGFTEAGSLFYKWIRDTGVGEITALNGGVFRVFFQSQIYLIFATLFIVIKHFFEEKCGFFNKISWWLLGTFFLSALFLSLSRSFGVGLIFALLFFWFTALIFFRKSPMNIFRSMVYFFSLVVGAGAVIILVTFIFSPTHQPLIFWQGAFSRSVSISDASAVTRWSQIKPIFLGISEHFFWGSGFGRTITFVSFDPRILSSNPTGLTTTSAFEWGWLDLWLKTGLIGIGLFIFLLFKIIFQGWSNAKLCLSRGQNNNLIYNLFFVFSLLSLAVIHFFTPYLNHPLGLGWLILTGLAIENLS